MARTPTPKRKAPTKAAAPAWQPISLRLPAPLVAEIDAIAVAERRPRVKQIEVVLEEFARAWRRRQENAE